jgi:DNA mismatch endonuclease (patch repair protein)
MRAIRSTGNHAEVSLRKALHGHGYRYRLYARSLPGKPDFVFARERVAVFVDGDFWHGREYREGGIEALQQRIKSPNKSYWIPKIQRNAERDSRVTAELEALGWEVVRIWESDVKRDLAAAVARVRRAVDARRTGGA